MKTYRPFETKQMSEKELRQEYSRLRRNANRRLANMEKNNLGRWGPNRFASSRGMSATWVEKALLDVSRYLRDPRHTVKGEREHMQAVIAGLHEKKIYGIDETNFYEFTDFIEDLRKKYSEKIYDSLDAAEVFVQMNRLGVDPELVMEKFDQFAKYSQRLHRLQIPRKESGLEYKALMNKIYKLK